MTEKRCEVTVVDSGGVRRTIETEASSVFMAAMNFDSKASTNSALKLPRPDDGTIYEVRVIDEDRVYRVNHRRLWQWANDQASRRNNGRTNRTHETPRRA